MKKSSDVTLAVKQFQRTFAKEVKPLRSQLKDFNSHVYKALSGMKMIARIQGNIDPSMAAKSKELKKTQAELLQAGKHIGELESAITILSKENLDSPCFKLS